MFATLKPLHDVLRDAGRNMGVAAAANAAGAAAQLTSKEQSFMQAYHADLDDTYELCTKFQHTNNTREITSAWDIYCHVFKSINRQLHSMTSLELQFISPKLYHVCIWSDLLWLMLWCLSVHIRRVD